MMGMFDYICYRAILPKDVNRARQKIALENGLAQSKSLRLWEDPRWSDRAYNAGCVTATVRDDGQLLDPDMAPLSWSGDLIFYFSDARVRFTTLRANMWNGKVLAIEKMS